MSTSYEQAVRGLGEATGAKIEIGADRVAMVEVEGKVVLLRPSDEAEKGMLAFAVVAQAEEDKPLAPSVFEKALELNLFGSGTGGGNLGLYGGTLVLSIAVPLAAGDTVALAERLVAFARLAGEVEKALREQTRSAQYGGELDGFYDDVINKVIIS